MEQLDLSVVIITHNEAPRIQDCLASLPKGAEVIVIDDFSDDGTASIAEGFGAKVIQNRFQDFSAQKNFGLAQASKNWILSIDADERLSSDLTMELVRLISSDSATKAVAYRIPRQLIFMGKALRYGRTIDYPIRLLQRGQASFQNPIHEVLCVDGKIETLKCSPILHNSYENLEDYFQRFNRYTSLIAERKTKMVPASLYLALWFRPSLEFIHRFFLRLGFLDGYQGYIYAVLSSFYAFTKYAKTYERWLQKN